MQSIYPILAHLEANLNKKIGNTKGATTDRRSFCINLICHLYKTQESMYNALSPQRFTHNYVTIFFTFVQVVFAYKYI